VVVVANADPNYVLVARKLDFAWQ